MDDNDIIAAFLSAAGICIMHAVAMGALNDQVEEAIVNAFKEKGYAITCDIHNG